MGLLEDLEQQYNLTPSVRSNIGNIQEQTGGSLLEQVEKQYNLGGEQPAQQEPTQQEGIYTGQVEEGTPITAGQRARLSFGDEEGIKQYLTSVGFEPTQDTEGNLLIKKDDKVYRLDEAGFSFKDIADMAGKTLPTGLSILGGIAGFLGAGPFGGAGLGALGGAIGETGRQAIGKVLDVNAPGGGLEEVGREAIFGGIGGATAGVGGVLARGATRALPALGRRVGEQLVPRLGTTLAGETVEAGLQGGIIRSGETFVRTGDIGEAGKQFGAGFAIGAPFGPVGYAALAPLQPLIARSMNRAAQTLSRVIPYDYWSNPQQIKNPIMRKFVQEFSDVISSARAFGTAGDELANSAENIQMHKLQLGATAFDNVDRGSAIWQTLTNKEKDEFLGLFAGAELGYKDLDTLLVSTKNPKIKEAIRYLFNAHREVSAELKGRSYVDPGTKEIVRFADQDPRPFIPHVREKPQAGTLEKQIALLMKKEPYVSMPKELALGKARKRAETMFANIKGVKKGVARKNYNLKSTTEYEDAGLISDPFEAMNNRLKQDIKIAAIHRELGDVLGEMTPPEKVAASRVTSTGKIEFEPGVISVNDLYDTLKTAGYQIADIDSLIYNVLMKEAKVGRSANLTDTLAYFTDVNEISDILNRELPKYGKIKEFTPEGKPIIEEVVKPISKETKVISEEVKNIDESIKEYKENIKELKKIFKKQLVGESEKSAIGSRIFELGENVSNLEAQKSRLLKVIAPEILPEVKLPKELAGAKPRYGFGKKLFQLTFESDIDKALYIVAQTKKSAHDESYMVWLRGRLPEIPDIELRRMGSEIRDKIKTIAKESTEEFITIPKTIDKPVEKPKMTTISAEAAKGLRKVTPEELKPLVSVTKLPKEAPIRLEDIEIEGGEGFRTYESELTAAIRGKFDDVYKSIDSHFENDPMGAAKAKEVIDRIFRVIDERVNFDEFASMLKSLGGLKFSLSFLRQPGQLINNLLRGDLPSAWKGIRAILNQTQPFTLGDIEIPGGTTIRRFTLESGAQQIPILDFDRNTKFQRFVNGVLTPLTKSEKGMMRISSSVTGANYAWSLSKIINQGGPQSLQAMNWLKALLRQDPTTVGGQVKLSYDDLKRAAYWFTKDTQFGFDPLRLPYFAGTTWGSVIFQGKNFAWNQARLMFNSTIGEIRAGNPGRATRNFMILAMLYAPAGYVIQSVINILTGKENDTDLATVDGWLKSITDSGAMGLTVDIFQAPNGHIFVSNMMGGPVLGGTGADAYNVLVGNMDIDDFLARQAGGGGRFVQNVGGIILGQ